MATVRGGIAVRKHVQAFADAAAKAVGVDSFGTYPGHDPTPDRALDVFVAAARYDSDPRLGDALCEWAMAHWELYGIDYMIWRRRIWNPKIARSWRVMAPRGGPVQDHFDHAHFSFKEDAPINYRTETEEANDMFTDEDRNTLRFLAAFAEESKRNACEAAGTDNWHEAGEKLNDRLNVIEAKLDAINER